MKAKELIKILEKYPQDIEVLGCNEHGNYELEESVISYCNNQDDFEKYGEDFFE